MACSRRNRRNSNVIVNSSRSQYRRRFTKYADKEYLRDLRLHKTNKKKPRR